MTLITKDLTSAWNRDGSIPIIFQKISLSPKSKGALRLKDRIVEIWPRDSIKDRVQYFEELGPFMVPWETRKGHIYLAESLHRLRDDPDQQIAQIISASIHDNHKAKTSIPTWFKGEGEVLKIIREQCPDIIYSWHPATRTMPVLAGNSWTIEVNRSKDIGKYEWEAVVKRARLDWALTMLTHTLVEISKEEEISGPVERFLRAQR